MPLLIYRHQHFIFGLCIWHHFFLVPFVYFSLQDSVSAESVEAGSNQEHIDKCTLPFLLHLALQAPRLVDQISEKVTDLRK